MLYTAFISYSHAADGALAPALQASLHRFAKPWYRLRAMRVFRDKTTLAMTTELWPAIEKALEGSEYFLLLASPQAAQSQWVQQEVGWWLQHRATTTLFIVLTEGEVVWDRAVADFDWRKTTALPVNLQGRFANEPLFVDLRWAKTVDNLSLRHSQFRAAILDMAATLHGKPKDELDGEDVRQHRKTKRLAWSASILLFVLFVAACIAAYVANEQKNIAVSREFATKAVANLDIDPDQSPGDALKAMEAFDTPEAETALREVLVRSSIRAVLSSKSGKITTASFSPDGARILSEAHSANSHHSLQLWDTLTGRFWCEVQDVNGGRFSTDGLLFYTSDGRAYDALTCQLQARNSPAEASVEVGTGKGAKAPFENQPPTVLTEVRFVDSTGTLDLVYQDDTPVIREVRTGKVLRSLSVYQDPIGGAVFSEDGGFGRLLISWARKGVYMESGGGPTEIGEKIARVWGIPYGDRDRVLSGHRRAINAAAFGPGAEFVVTGSDDRTARVWMTYSGDEFAVLRGHMGPVKQVAISPNGAHILTVSDDGTARIWEPGSVRTTKVGMADLFTLHYGIPLPTLQGDELPVDTLVLSADRTTLLAKVSSSRMTVWDTQTGQRRGSVSDEEYGELRGWLSPDGTRVVTTTGQPSVACCSEVARVWDVGTGRLIAELRGQNGPLYGAAYSPNGQVIVTYGDDGIVRLWDATTFTLVRELPTSGDRMLHAAFSSDGNRLVTASRDSLGRIWDVKNGELLRELFGHQGGVTFAAFSPDDTLILSVGDDETRIWDASTGKMLGRYMGSGDTAIAFISHDCSKLVTDVSGNEGSGRVHVFGACGKLDRLMTMARIRKMA